MSADPTEHPEARDAGTEHEAVVRRMLALLGEDPERDGLRKTPHRVAEALGWLTRGTGRDAAEEMRPACAVEAHDTMVLVRDIEFYSLCEHHMLPFFGRAHVAYLPDARVLAASELPRVVEIHARRLQVQERLGEQVADALETLLRPRGVGVVLEAVHLCMMMRGVEKQNSRTVTSALRGSFRDDARTRDEFLRLAHARE
jgi:GTP cyclohydrolase I